MVLWVSNARGRADHDGRRALQGADEGMKPTSNRVELIGPRGCGDDLSDRLGSTISVGCVQGAVGAAERYRRPPLVLKTNCADSRRFGLKFAVRMTPLRAQLHRTSAAVALDRAQGARIGDALRMH
jgi:hypothetical protein